MYRMFFVFLKCTVQGGPKLDVLLIDLLHLSLNIWEGIDKYWIVPVRKLFYFHHCLQVVIDRRPATFLSATHPELYNIISTFYVAQEAIYAFRNW